MAGQHVGRGPRGNRLVGSVAALEGLAQNILQHAGIGATGKHPVGGRIARLGAGDRGFGLIGSGARRCRAVLEFRRRAFDADGRRGGPVAVAGWRADVFRRGDATRSRLRDGADRRGVGPLRLRCGRGGGRRCGGRAAADRGRRFALGILLVGGGDAGGEIPVAAVTLAHPRHFQIGHDAGGFRACRVLQRFGDEPQTDALDDQGDGPRAPPMRRTRCGCDRDPPDPAPRADGRQPSSARDWARRPANPRPHRARSDARPATGVPMIPCGRHGRAG